MKKVAIFGSGRGSNALSLLEYFDENPDVEVSLIVSNKKDTGILQHAYDYNIPSFVVDKYAMENEKRLSKVLQDEQIDYIVLAGFLWLIPENIVKKYEGKIINIHPSLLPDFGGHGMYGMNVHNAVFNSGNKISGISIHEVNQNYDDGAIIYQEECEISDCKSPQEVAAKILELEHKNYPLVVDNWIKSKMS
ncbi:MAG: phosphoribosylglycinamide formyltransferase [Saprospiraceae bacterium]|nr:phosphoribosylglycinamide formyltransferase [Saprospiraceae bacterium]HPK09722.1 phosphoribosylglycinamide formyltransferase [Saprospiraceae bacterium]